MILKDRKSRPSKLNSAQITQYKICSDLAAEDQLMGDKDVNVCKDKSKRKERENSGHTITWSTIHSTIRKGPAGKVG